MDLLCSLIFSPISSKATQGPGKPPQGLALFPVPVLNWQWKQTYQPGRRYSPLCHEHVAVHVQPGETSLASLDKSKVPGDLVDSETWTQGRCSGQFTQKTASLAPSARHVVGPCSTPSPGISLPCSTPSPGISLPYSTPLPGISLPYPTPLPGIFLPSSTLTLPEDHEDHEDYDPEYATYLVATMLTQDELQKRLQDEELNRVRFAPEKQFDWESATRLWLLDTMLCRDIRRAVRGYDRTRSVAFEMEQMSNSGWERDIDANVVYGVGKGTPGSEGHKQLQDYFREVQVKKRNRFDQDEGTEDEMRKRRRVCNEPHKTLKTDKGVEEEQGDQLVNQGGEEQDTGN